MFSRLTKGTSQISISKDETSGTRKQRINYILPDPISVYWDALGFRANNGLEFVPFVASSTYEASGLDESSLNQFGAKIGFHPLRTEWTNWFRTDMTVGIGYEYIELKTMSKENSDYYTKLTGGAYVASVGVDLVFFRWFGLALTYNGFRGQFNQYETSSSARIESDRLQNTVDANPKISGVGSGVGLMLNIDM
ncbi:MAG: hypothetical protein NTX25_02210 [Proteobacteria bacterium]|nr:hypothetical protein [Pseudomonadota bacterium]